MTNLNKLFYNDLIPLTTQRMRYFAYVGQRNLHYLSHERKPNFFDVIKMVKHKLSFDHIFPDGFRSIAVSDSVIFIIGGGDD